MELLQSGQDEQKCKGIYFRYRKNSYFSGGKLVMSDSFTILKRMSCPGCDKCGWVVDYIKEDLCCNLLPLIDKDLTDYDICTIIPTNISTDWETGYVDSMDLKFVKVSA